MSILQSLQQEVADCLLADPFFATIPVLVEQTNLVQERSIPGVVRDSQQDLFAVKVSKMPSRELCLVVWYLISISFLRCGPGPIPASGSEADDTLGETNL